MHEDWADDVTRSLADREADVEAEDGFAVRLRRQVELVVTTCNTWSAHVSTCTEIDEPNQVITRVNS